MSILQSALFYVYGIFTNMCGYDGHAKILKEPKNYYI